MTLRRQVHAHEAGQADALAEGGHVEDVVLALQRVRLAGDHQREFRQLGHLLARDHVLRRGKG